MKIKKLKIKLGLLSFVFIGLLWKIGVLPGLYFPMLQRVKAEWIDLDGIDEGYFWVFKSDSAMGYTGMNYWNGYVAVVDYSANRNHRYNFCIKGAGLLDSLPFSEKKVAGGKIIFQSIGEPIVFCLNNDSVSIDVIIPYWTENKYRSSSYFEEVVNSLLNDN